MTVPLSWYLALSAALFSIGVFGVLSRRNAVGVLMGVELMLNAVNINLVAFWHYGTFGQSNGLAFALIVIAIAAAEAAVGLALIISVCRRRKTVVVEDVNLMKF